MGAQVRLAGEDDAPGIACIYAHSIAGRVATLETESWSVEAIRAAFAERGDIYPTASPSAQALR